MKYLISVNGRSAELEVEAPAPGKVRFRLNGEAFEGEILEVEPNVYLFFAAARSYEIRLSERSGAWEACCGGQRFEVSLEDPRRYRPAMGAIRASGAEALTALMPGKVVKVFVAPGDEVEANQAIAVVEAMKMQNEIRAPRPGRVVRLNVNEGSSVGAGETLAVIE